MLDDVGEEHRLGRQAGVGECAVQQSSGRTHEGLAGAVLVVTRLLPHEHQRRVLRTPSRDPVGGVTVELTALARLDSGVQTTR
jgi:hypothetical protein